MFDFFLYFKTDLYKKKLNFNYYELVILKVTIINFTNFELVSNIFEIKGKKKKGWN